jgi:hypothetical protein
MAVELNEIKIGDQLTWQRVVSNYGHSSLFPVTVLKIGKRRIRVVIDGGGTTSVEAHNLYPRAKYDDPLRDA